MEDIIQVIQNLLNYFKTWMLQGLFGSSSTQKSGEFVNFFQVKSP